MLDTHKPSNVNAPIAFTGMPLVCVEFANTNSISLTLAVNLIHIYRIKFKIFLWKWFYNLASPTDRHFANNEETKIRAWEQQNQYKIVHAFDVLVECKQ